MEEQSLSWRTRLENISFYVLLCMTALLPLFFVPSSFISTQFGTSLLFAGGVIAVLLTLFVSSLVSGKVRIPQSALYGVGLFAVVPVIYFLAGIGNGFSRLTFLGLSFDQSTVGFILLSFAYMFTVAMLFGTKQRVFYSHVVFLLSSLVFALFLFVRMMFGPTVLSFGIFDALTTTVIGSWNNVGIFFGVNALLSLIAYMLLPVSKIMKMILSVALILSLFFLTMVNFNIIWIILGITALLLIVYTMWNREPTVGSTMQKVRRVPLYPSLVLLVSIIFVIWGGTLGTKIETFFKISNVEVRPSLSVTMDIARQTLSSHPLFGSGPNTFVTEWLSYKPDDITSTVFWNTDFAYGIGLLPTFAVTTGLFGVLSWLFFFAVFIYLGWKALFARIEDMVEKYVVVASFFVSLYLWIMAIVYVPSTILFIITFFFSGLFIASLYMTGVLQQKTIVLSEDPKKGYVWSLGLVALCVAVGALGFGIFKNAESLWYYQKSSYALNTSGDVTASETLMAKAIAAVPADLYYRSLSEIETAKLNAIVNQDPKTVTQDTLQKEVSATLSTAIQAGMGARDADPTNYLNWISLGRVYESAVPLKVQGAFESAQFSYGEAIRRNPKNPGILLLLAQLSVDNGDLASARAYATQAINAKQNYLDAYYLLAQIEVADKNLKGAIDSVSAAAILSPTDPTVFFQLGLLKYNAGDFAGAIDALAHSLTLSPQYANAKYFLGLSYEATGDHAHAIAEFTDLAATNTDNTQVAQILAALKAGKPIFTNPAATTAKTGKNLPVKETQQ